MLIKKVVKGNKYNMIDRELCSRCGKNPKAINYKKENKIYYRSVCESCIVKTIKRSKTEWIQSGYKKKLTCEVCTFIPKYPDQLTVYKYKSIFKTICLNCRVEANINDQIFINKVKPDF